MSPAWPWATAAALGAFHGLNPAMGWLFAVALGLQEGRRGAVLRALPPIALGHAVAVGAVLALFVGLQVAVPVGAVRLLAAAALIGFGVFRLLRPSAHPRWVGMRVGPGDLVLWSFLMASAHGAGLMLAPVVFGLPSAGHGGHAPSAAPGLAVLLVHTAAMFAVMTAVALVVFETVGVAFLRRAWVNVDLVWAGALILAGGVTLWMAA